MIQKYNIDKELSALTTIPVLTLQTLADKAMKCIGHDVLSCYLKGEPVANICLGDIGTLSISLVDDEVHYRYVPSMAMRTMIEKTLASKSSPLIESVESTLGAKIVNTYKDFI